MKLCLPLRMCYPKCSGSISLYCYRFEQQSLTDNNKVENVVIARMSQRRTEPLPKQNSLKT